MDRSPLSSLPLTIDGEALWRRLQELATFGARSDGGVDRPALSATERAARRRLIEWADALGATSHIDPAGNMFFRRAGIDDLDPVLFGSHIDSQPNGGRYDGAYGVVAGFALLEAAARAQLVHARPIEVVVWNNEEGSRYSPGAMGSALFAGQIGLDALRDVQDADGLRFADELEATIVDAKAAGARERKLGFPVHAFIEPHIEQGPILEREGLPVGIVDGIQGLRWYRVTVHGSSAHAGTTPRAARRDAFVGAAELAAALRAPTIDSEDAVRFTIGRFRVFPGSPNTIAERAEFSVDLRHNDDALLTSLDEVFAELAQRSWSGCSVEMERVMTLSPVSFDERVISLLEQGARTSGRSYRRMTSGAFHDATHMASLCPTAMVFIPCAAGISHNPLERIEPHDALAGAEVAIAAIVALAQS